MIGTEQTLPPHEDEVQRAPKQARVGQRGAKKRSDPQMGPSAWLPSPMLDVKPLLTDASICDFQGGNGGYIADAVEQALLLLGDMAEL